MLFLKISDFCRGLQLLNRTGINASHFSTTQSCHLIGMPPVGISRSYLELERHPKRIILSGHFVDIDQCREVLSQNLGVVMQIRHVNDTFIGETGQLQIDLDSFEDKGLPAWAVRSIHVPIITQLTGELGWHLASTFPIKSYVFETDPAGSTSPGSENGAMETVGGNRNGVKLSGEAEESSHRERPESVHILPEKKYFETTETETDVDLPRARRRASFATRHGPQSMIPRKEPVVKVTGQSGETLGKAKPLFSTYTGTPEQSQPGQDDDGAFEKSTQEKASGDKYQPDEDGPDGSEHTSPSRLDAVKIAGELAAGEETDKAIKKKESVKAEEGDGISAIVYCFERITSIKPGNPDNIASQGWKALQLVIP